MAIMKIYKYGDEILTRVLKPVESSLIKKDLQQIIKDMFETMESAQGAGLAANQVGLDMRLVVIKVPKGEDEGEFIKAVLINPVIVEKSGRMYEEEGCLSFPGIFAKVKRYAKVKVHAFNEKGIPVEINAEGFFAKAIQHEIDHLDGITFIDRLPMLTKLKIKPALLRIKHQKK